jgi:hypothetical protein
MTFDVLKTMTTKIYDSWNVVLRAATTTFLLLPDYLTPRYRTHSTGRAMAEADGCRHRGSVSITGHFVWCCGGQSGTGTRFSPSTLASPYQYHSADPPCSLIDAL